MNSVDLSQTIAGIANNRGLPVPIVTAVVQVESGGDRYATRFEWQYRYLWDIKANKPYTATTSVAQRPTAPDDFPGPSVAHAGFFTSADTEWAGQKTSWGPMQIMGANARWLGYPGPFPQLCQPDIGIEYGCRLLAHYRDLYLKRHGWAGVLDAWNDGTPRIEKHPDYPDKIAAVSPAAYALVHPGSVSGGR